MSASGNGKFMAKYEIYQYANLKSSYTVFRNIYHALVKLWVISNRRLLEFVCPAEK